MAHRTLRVHAAVVGGGWIVVALAALALSHTALSDWLGELPRPLRGAGLTVVAVSAMPLAWPIYIAIGWYEANLADEVQLGDRSASARARHLLLVQAACFALAGVAAAVAAITFRRVNGAAYLAFAWAPLVLIGLAHLITARSLRASDRLTAWPSR